MTRCTIRKGAGRNERLSAELCAAEMSRSATPEATARAIAATLATIGHVLPSPEDCPDAALLLDIDLSILGQPTPAFDRYDAQIREEYAHVEESIYRPARAGILRTFLTRERLYLTDWGFAQWEQPARANLAAAIERLEAPVIATGAVPAR